MKKSGILSVGLAILSAFMISAAAEAGVYEGGVWTSNTINVIANAGPSPFEPLPSVLHLTATSSADIHMTLNGPTFTDKDVYINYFTSTGEWVYVGQFPKGGTGRFFNVGKEGRLDAALWNGLFVNASYDGVQPWPSFNATLKVYGLTESTPVPIPGAVWLLGSGLLGLVAIRRKFKK